MSDVNISLAFNEHRLSKLNDILTENGSSVEQELQSLVNGLYEKIVPQNERNDIENLIKREAEELANRNSDCRFAVIRLHDKGDEIFFTTNKSTSFYDICKVYCDDLRPHVHNYSIDSLACQFDGYNPINEVLYSVLADIMPDDNRISALTNFDFEHNRVSVCESSSNVWHTYSLDDIAQAMRDSQQKSYSRLRSEIFSEEIKDIEIDFGSSEDQSITIKPL